MLRQFLLQVFLAAARFLSSGKECAFGRITNDLPAVVLQHKMRVVATDQHICQLKKRSSVLWRRGSAFQENLAVWAVPFACDHKGATRHVQFTDRHLTDRERARFVGTNDS